MEYRFGYTNLIEGAVEQQGATFDVPKEWKSEATYIEKAKKRDAVTYVGNNNQLNLVPSPGYSHGGFYNGYGLNRMYADIDEVEKVEEKDEKKQLPLSPQFSWDRQTMVNQKEKDKMEEITQLFVDGSITHHDFVEEARKECPNIDPYSYMDSLGAGYKP